jgi:hypothetical protein
MTTLRTVAAVITIAELGTQYATEEARAADDVQVVTCGIDPGPQYMLDPDAKRVTGLDFTVSALRLTYNEELVCTIEQGYRPDKPNRYGFWILTDENAYVAEMDTPLMITGRC